ncbi:MAG TPA: metallophosphoesterase [Aliidongia sp.]|nr:metallophosphoesterase [Aliidongia sp.]
MVRALSERQDSPVFHEPVFNETQDTPVPPYFTVPHPSDDDIYKQVEDLLTKDVVGFAPSRGAPDDLFSLAEAYGDAGASITGAIAKNGHIVFDVIGDSGASAAMYFKDEISVAARLTEDMGAAAATDRAAFLYHLGDVVYDFGEAQYYYDQFYDPFRNYAAPIFAIPGNHDSFVVPGTATGQAPLDIFTRNFCAAEPAVTAEAKSLHRTAMTQPGVYFTLDAPFVRIIGLFSNALEDPGVISSESGKWSAVPDYQLDYLAAQLKRVKTDNYKGALLLATHHPAFSYTPPPSKGASGSHDSSTAMQRQIDQICQSAGVYPHAFLSGHAHNYQRYTRTVSFGGGTYQVPFFVCGASGHHVNALVRSSKGHPAQEPKLGTDVGYLDPSPAVEAKGLVIANFQDRDYGYLKVTADPATLRFDYFLATGTDDKPTPFDTVTVDLAKHTIETS